MTTLPLRENCIVCDVAIGGRLGWMSKAAGIRRSSGNPNLCNRCNGHVEEGGIREVGVFFVDLSNYTTLTTTLGPAKIHEILDNFLRRASDIIVRHDGYVSQFVGDEIMAFFNAPISRDNYASLAVNAAIAIQEAVEELGGEFDLPLRATIGIGSGFARIGRVGTEGVAHFSAIGDVVNRAARLVARSEPGGMIVDKAIYDRLDANLQKAQIEEVDLKGFPAPVPVARFGDVRLLPSSPEMRTARDRIGFLTSFAAILSAPCAGYVALNSVALAVGGGAFGMGAIALWLDQSFIRIPLLLIATLGALSIGALSLKQVLSSDAASENRPTRTEILKNRTGLGISALTLLIVTAELFAHSIMH